MTKRAYGTGDAVDTIELCETAAAWMFFHNLFRLPSDVQWDWLRGPEVAAAWNLIATRVGTMPEQLPLPEHRQEYEETFLSVFEVGLPAPLCPLIESHWHRAEPAPKVLHENVLFYKQFGLQLRSAAAEQADHLRCQSEFMYYLSSQELDWRRNRERAAMAESCAQGRNDFLARHVLTWLPEADNYLSKICPNTWQVQWLSMLASFVTG